MKSKGMKISLTCDFCGARIERYPSRVKKHNFCSQKCLADYSSKTRNPEKYTELKSYEGMSQNMKAINARLNPSRMAPAVRLKLRNSRLAKGSSGKGYEKLLGRHIHRTVAELAIGRSLKPGEVVHHIDGNIHNNDYRNLMVFENQAQHATWHAAHDTKNEEVMPDDVQTA